MQCLGDIRLCSCTEAIVPDLQGSLPLSSSSQGRGTGSGGCMPSWDSQWCPGTSRSNLVITLVGAAAQQSPGLSEPLQAHASQST